MKSQGTRQDLYANDINKKKELNMGKRLSLFARLERVKTLLAYPSYKGFQVYQMNVKTIFVNKILGE